MTYDIVGQHMVLENLRCYPRTHDIVTVGRTKYNVVAYDIKKYCRYYVDYDIVGVTYDVVALTYDIVGDLRYRR